MHDCIVFNASVNANYWYISSALLWCVASTRTTRRSLITTPSPSPMSVVARRRGQAFAYSTKTSYPPRSRWTDMQQWIRHCRSSSSNIIVRLLEEEKSQAQTERCMRTLEHAYSEALAWDKIAMWAHYCSTPSVRKYLSSKWIKGDVSRCILVLDTSIFIYFDNNYFRTEW